MRRLWSLCLVTALIVPAVPALASPPSGGNARQQTPQQSGAINGILRNAKGDVLPNHRLRVRDASTGRIVAESTSNASGGFSIAGLAPGTYVIEVVNDSGHVVALSSSVAVSPGLSSTAAVTTGAAGSQLGGGFSLFGLGTGASVGVIAAAGAAGVAGIVSATHNASPSK